VSSVNKPFDGRKQITITDKVKAPETFLMGSIRFDDEFRYMSLE
jgi:hypothetical protein